MAHKLCEIEYPEFSIPLNESLVNQIKENLKKIEVLHFEKHPEMKPENLRYSFEKCFIHASLKDVEIIFSASIIQEYR